MRTLYHGGELFDATGAAVGPGDVVTDGERIVEVGTGLDADVGVDVTGHTLLPGLIDCHVHVMISGIDMIRALEDPYSLRCHQAARNLGLLLDAGLTSVRDAGGADLGTKQAVRSGLVRGPRLQIAVTMLSQTGGHADPWLPSGSCMPTLPPTPSRPASVVDGTEQMRLRVRELVRAGADWIKVASSGGVMSPGTDPMRPQFSQEELDVSVAEAAVAGLGVMAHAQATQGIRNAVLAGVRSIEHGIYLNDEVIELMLARKTVLVPTLIAPLSVLEAAKGGAAISESSRRKVAEIIEAHRISFRRAVEAGVPIAMGTDAVGFPHGRNLEELALMQQSGMATENVLRSASAVAAKLLGLDSELGTIEVGKRADMVIVRGQLGDLSDLRQRISGVLKDGVLVAGQLPPAAIRPD